MRPDACQVILSKLNKLVYSEEKKDYLSKFLKYFKEWQTLNQKTSRINKQIGGIQDDSILDAETASKILTTINLNASASGKKRTTSPIDDSPQKKSFGSFKSMKKNK